MAKLDNYAHLMIDLETYALGDDAVILSVGISAVDSNWNEFDSLYLNIDIEDQVAAGRKIDSKTVEWWSKQSEEAVNTIFDNPDYPQVDVYTAATTVREFIDNALARHNKKVLYWGNSNRFDVGKLNSFLLDFAGQVYSDEYMPDYYQRCFKTLRDVSESFYGVKYNREDVKHDALADARQQVEFVKRLHGYSAGIKLSIEAMDDLGVRLNDTDIIATIERESLV